MPTEHRRRMLNLALAVVVSLSTITLTACQPDGPAQEDIALPPGAMLDEPQTEPSRGQPVVAPVPERRFGRGGVPAPGVVPTTLTSDTRTPGPVDAPRQRVTGFIESEHPLRPIPVGHRPYESGQVRPVPFGMVDTEGVRVFQTDWDGEVYDHPIAQAQYALTALESYRLTGEQEYLDVAVRNAERIIERRDVIREAWYYPYDFDFDLFRNGRGVLTAPWVSGMASGQALSLFARLHEVTQEDRWQVAADATFAGFLQAPDGAGYFVAFVDDAGRLWLEEYSRYPESSSERVLNGHMWSMFGLYDYWEMHEQNHPEAERLFRGALYTLEATAMPEFRHPGWASYYSLWQRQPAHTYHLHHQQQFLMIYRMTHDPSWVTHASTLRADWPRYRITTGRAVLTPQVHEAYLLDDEAVHVKDRTMEVLETRVVDHPERRTVAYDRRGRIPGGPVVIRLSEGELAGWWVEETPGHAWPAHPVEFHSYEPPVLLQVTEDAEITIYHYDSLGELIDTRRLSPTPGATYPSDRSAYLQGRPYYQISDGPLRGWWLPEGTAQLTSAG